MEVHRRGSTTLRGPGRPVPRANTRPSTHRWWVARPEPSVETGAADRFALDAASQLRPETFRSGEGRCEIRAVLGSPRPPLAGSELRPTAEAGAASRTPPAAGGRRALTDRRARPGRENGRGRRRAGSASRRAGPGDEAGRARSTPRARPTATRRRGDRPTECPRPTPQAFSPPTAPPRARDRSQQEPLRGGAPTVERFPFRRLLLDRLSGWQPVRRGPNRPLVFSRGDFRGSPETARKRVRIRNLITTAPRKDPVKRATGRLYRRPRRMA